MDVIIIVIYHDKMVTKPGNDSFNIIFSSMDALKGSQQPIPLSPCVTQPLLRPLHPHTHAQSGGVDGEAEDEVTAG